jgi:hypothetical protein
LDECRGIAVSSLSRDTILAPAASVTLSILVPLFATGFGGIGLFGRKDHSIIASISRRSGTARPAPFVKVGYSQRQNDANSAYRSAPSVVSSAAGGVRNNHS